MGKDNLLTHLKGGLTTVCRAWAITRKDGLILGFTDHDKDLTWEGVTFRANAGLTAFALQQTSGLSVDNTDALGAFRDEAIKETEIADGLYDGAEVKSWQVNWANPEDRRLLFKGHVGEIRRGAGAFEAELRGLTDALNQPQGRAYHKECSAVLGSSACGVDLNEPGYFSDQTIEVASARRFEFDLPGFDADWFARGVLEVTSGSSQGLKGIIRRDSVANGRRVIDLWQALPRPLAVGDTVRLLAGCDKRRETCKAKFDNLLNFQGFPFIPGEDWLSMTPSSSAVNRGGSLQS